MKHSYPYHGAEIAIVGMAGKFPGANSVEELWQNLNLHREGIRSFTKEDLQANRVSDALLDNEHYVKAKGVVSESNSFDAQFFSYSDREASLMDPQLRLLHECAWHALEDAGYAGTDLNDQLVGVFSGASANALWTSQYANTAQKGGAEAYEIINLINRDFFNSRLSYKLNLTGPAVTIQTACSTGLVAVHSANQSLLSGDSDIALAGAVSLSLNPALKSPEEQGYLYQEGMILSPDGHCRPFDENAKGTVLSDGVGFVVLKRLQDAIDADDRIYAVIKGSAINNDGNAKVGFTAPSVSGQTDVIEAALALADVEPESVGYIESHGTGTNLGDPIEFQSLQQTYGRHGDQPCYVGSIKSNIGHLDTAAGIAGLIKATLAVQRGSIPGILHFEKPNPKCDLSNSRLHFSAENMKWESDKALRAGVSSFGIGGTNAHLILEEYIAQTEEISEENEINSPYEVLPLSAKSEVSLHQYYLSLSPWLASKKSIVDVAYSLRYRRTEFASRRALVCDEQGREIYASNPSTFTVEPKLYWMFSGQGTQYPSMGRGLYQAEPVYKNSIDRCIGIIQSHGGPDLSEFLIDENIDETKHLRMASTQVTQLCLFSLEYSLAQLLQSWGFKADAYIGHSLGEYVAACLAGVFSLDDALKIIIARGHLMSKTESGSMLAIHATRDSISLDAWPGLSVAAINSANNFVVSGADADIERLTSYLSGDNINHTILQTSHAFHSSLMDPILDEFRSVLESIQFNEANTPIVSNVSGEWANKIELCDPEYWVSHMRGTVQFKDGIETMLANEDVFFLELGPGKTLCSLARQAKNISRSHRFASSLRQSRELEDDRIQPQRMISDLYAAGVKIDWQSIDKGRGKLCSLPSYVFESKPYLPSFSGFSGYAKRSEEGGFYKEVWHRLEDDSLTAIEDSAQEIIVFHTDRAPQRSLIGKLSLHNASVIEVVAGQEFKRLSDRVYSIRPSELEDYALLVQDLTRVGISPNKILQLWQYDELSDPIAHFLCSVLLVQSLAKIGFKDPIDIYAICAGGYRVNGDEIIHPRASLSFGAMRVISQEFANASCYQIDAGYTESEATLSKLSELLFVSGLPLLSAIRGDYLWQRDFKFDRSSVNSKAAPFRFRQQGVYLITGAFGGIGRELAQYLAQICAAKLILVSRNDRTNDPLVANLESYGAEILCLTADLSNPEEISNLFNSSNQSFGKLDGIFHCAGLPGDSLILRQNADKSYRTIASKYLSAEKIVELSEINQPEFIVLFSSVTGVLGGMGQLDYCAANAGLDALAESCHAKGRKNVYSIRWDAWKETGMAMDAFNSDIKVIKKGSHDFLGDLLIESQDRYLFKRKVSVSTCWALAEHIVMGIATLPGSVYTDMAIAAIRNITDLEAVQLNDLYFLSPLSLKIDEDADLYTLLERKGDSFSVEIGSFNLKSKHWTAHAKAELTRTNTIEASAVVIEAIKQQCQLEHLRDIQGAAHLGMLAMRQDLSQTQQDALMKYGDRWSVVKEVWLGEGRALARLQLNSIYQQDLEQMPLHPALLDCALSFYRAFLDGGVYIPISYGLLKQYRAIPAAMYSLVTLRSKVDSKVGAMSFDVNLFTEDGVLIAQVTDFTMRKIDQDFSEKKQSKSNVIPDYVNQYKTLPLGISTADGLQAIESVLTKRTSLSLLAVSDFNVRHETAGNGETSLFSLEKETIVERRPRPDTSAEFVAPKTMTQKIIASIWSEMLGFEKVGIQDDFFELGGDSLLLMQIHKKVQAQIESELAVVELYNFPTIQKLADFIDNSGDEKEDLVLADISDRIEKQKASARRRRKKHH